MVDAQISYTSDHASLQYRADIDGLRALAITVVLLYHFGFGMPGGYVGVDVFFVISGYLITKTLLARPPNTIGSLISFGLRRLRRLTPAMIVMVASILFIANFILVPTELQALAESILRVLTFSSNYFFMGQAGYFDAPSLSKPLLHTWSLSLEGQYYLTFGLLICILLTVKTLNNRDFGSVALKLVLITIFLSSFVYACNKVSSHPSEAFYTLVARLWEFIIGALIAVDLVPRVRGLWLPKLLQAMGLGLIIFACLAYDQNTRFPGLNALLPVIGASLFIYSGTSLNRVNKSYVTDFIECAPVVYLGKISYALYLWHWPLLVIATLAAGRQLRFIEASIIILLAISLSVLTYHWIEKPFNKWTHSRARKLVLTIFLLFTVIIIVSFSNWLIRADGLSNRLSDQGRKLMTASKDIAPRADGCHTINPNRVGNDDLCLLGALNGKSMPEFVVWGDSHAHALLGEFDELANTYIIEGRHGSRAACPPLLDVRLLTQTDDICNQFNKRMVEYLDRHNVGHVFLVARWPVYTDGFTPGGIESGLEPRLITQKGLSIQQSFEAALDATLAGIRRPGRIIYLVTTVPEVTHHVPSSLARSTLLLGPNPEALRPSREMIKLRQKVSIHAFERAARVLDVRVINLQEQLCDAKSCEIARDGQSLYRDSDHLSAYGAGAVREVFEPIFRNIRGQRQ